MRIFHVLCFSLLTPELIIIASLEGPKCRLKTGSSYACLCFFCRVLAQYGLGLADEDNSVGVLEEEYSKVKHVSLNDCIALHTKEEEVCSIIFISFVICMCRGLES